MGRTVSARVDWSTTVGCPRCNEHGPLYPSGVIYDPWGDRARHQAWHELAAHVVAPMLSLLLRVLTWVAGRIEGER